MLPPVILVLADALEKMLFVVLVVAEDVKPKMLLVFETGGVTKMLLPAVVGVEARLLNGLIPMLVDAEDVPLELLLVKPNMPQVFSPFFALEEKLTSAALALVVDGTEA